MIDVDQLSPNGFQLTDVFPVTILEDLSRMCDTFEPDHIRPSGTGDRRSVVLNANFKESIKKSCVDIIFQITQKPINFFVAELWRDYPNYSNDLHVDDPAIENIMIVYLGSGSGNLGTHWFEDGIEYSVPYTNNCGLVLLNSNTISHGMIGSVTEVDYRKSLYLNWKTPV